MQFQRRHFAALAGAAVLTPWSIAQAQTPAALEALHAAAKTEGEVSWYIAFLPSEDAEILSRAFSARYPGVKVNVVRTTAQVAYQRLNQDLQAKSAHCDVFSSTDVGHYLDLKQRKLLTKYTPAASALMDKRLQNIDTDGYFHVASVATIGLIYTTQKVTAEEAPKSWNDLTDPKWRGLASVGHPGFSGFVGVWAIEMKKLYGTGWFKKLAANKPQVGRSIIDTVTTLTSGERSVAAGPVNLAAMVASKGNPLAVVAPKEGLVLMLSPSAIMANAPHPFAAKLFMEFLIGSDETEKLAYDRFGIPKRAGAKPRPGVIGLDDAGKLLRPTPQQSVDELPEVIDLWRDAFGV
jgi:iron(III) transport system substrate-binding protein